MYYLIEKKLPFDIRQLTYRLCPNDDKLANQYYYILIQFRNTGRKKINPKTKKLFNLIEQKFGIWWSEYVVEE